jgi:hypothetical protein
MKINKFLIGTVAGVGILLATIVPALAANTTVVVHGNTAAGENQPGWLFNRDVSTSTPFEFNTDHASVGTGSLFVKPIGSNPSDKFIAENFLATPVSNINSISYDFLIAGNGTASSAGQFYLNVYANIDNSTNFYDCRYDYVPSTGSTSSFTTFTVHPGDTPTNVTKRGSRFSGSCPATLAGMPSGSYVRVFAINVGDTSASDTGLAGYLDNVVTNLSSGTTTYDFEPLPNVNVTIVKYLDGSPATALSANNASFPMTATWNAANIGAGTGTYALGPTGFNNPNPYQATTSDMTQGASYTTSEVTNNINSSSNVLPVGATCQTGKTRLVGYSFGDNQSAAANASTSSMAPNFTNLTSNKFVIVRNETCTNPPTSFAQCNGNGWKTFNNPTFKNAGLCVAYVATHQHNVDGSITYTANSLVRHAILMMNSALDSGIFFYWDANNDWYTVTVSDINVNGNTAWFAGKVTSASQPSWVGQWLFAKVVDNSPDMIWGSFTSQATAENGVTSMSDPADGPFNVTSGNVTVH